MSRSNRSDNEIEFRFYQIIECFADPICLLDARLYIRYVNKSFITLLGLDYHELISRPFTEFLPLDRVPDTAERLGKVLASPDDVANLEIQFRNGSNVWLDLELCAKHLCNQLNQGMIVMHLKDITGRKLAEEERERLQSQLIQAQKMESIGRLAGGVAHDFNNMLLVILGHAELLGGKLPPGDPMQADLNQIKKAAHRSADLTRQLLAFARKQVIAPKALDLNQTTESLLKMLKRLIGEDIDLLWKPAEGIGQVLMDPSQVDQILVNLCVNARDAIDQVGKAGKVTIETGTAVFDDDYCATHLGVMPGKFVLLAVSDDGCGMDNETLSHIFEPFFTTKESGKGTGLGLSTVYGIVTQNNGFITVYSEPGIGTTFKVHLPRLAGQQPQVAERERDESASRQGCGTILLVEDEQAILDMTREMLEGFGYRVLAATTPSAAIALARGRGCEIDLLITDVVMPEMSGRELAQHLLQIHPNLKRLFMSGYTANVIANHGVLDEGVSFLEKPFSMKELSAKVRAVLEEGAR